MVGSVQANVQNHLASPHSRRLPAGEDEIHVLLEIALRQTADVADIPVVDFSRTVRKVTELRDDLGSGRSECMRQSLEVMLKDSVDRVDVIEDAKREGCILAGQPVEVAAYDIVEAAI